MVYIGGVMLHLRMARLATVENLCKTRPAWFIQKPKARARCSGLIAVCPESLAAESWFTHCKRSARCQGRRSSNAGLAGLAKENRSRRRGLFWPFEDSGSSRNHHQGGVRFIEANRPARRESSWAGIYGCIRCDIWSRRKGSKRRI